MAQDINQITGAAVHIKWSATSGTAGTYGDILFNEAEKAIYANGIKFTLSDAEVSGISYRISGLEKDNVTVKQVLAGYIDSNDTFVKTVKSDVDALSGAIYSANTGINAKIDSLSGSIDALSGSINDPDSGINKKLDTISGTVYAEDTGLVDQVSALNTAVSGNDGLSSRIDTVGASVTTLAGTVDTLSGALSDRIDALDTAVSGENGISSKIVALQTEDTNLWGALTGVATRISGVDTRVSGLEAQIGTLADASGLNNAINTINQLHAEIVNPENASGVVGSFIDAVDSVLSGFSKTTGEQGEIKYSETVKGYVDGQMSGIYTYVDETTTAIYTDIASGVDHAISTASGMNSTTVVTGSANITVTDSIESGNDHSYTIASTGLLTTTEFATEKNALLTGIADAEANAIAEASGMAAVLDGKITTAQDAATLKWEVI